MAATKNQIEEQKANEKQIKKLEKEIKELEEVIATLPYGLKASELQRIVRAKKMKIFNLKSDKKPNKYSKCVSLDNK